MTPSTRSFRLSYPLLNSLLTLIVSAILCAPPPLGCRALPDVLRPVSNGYRIFKEEPTSQVCLLLQCNQLVECVRCDGYVLWSYHAFVGRGSKDAVKL